MSAEGTPPYHMDDYREAPLEDQLLALEEARTRIKAYDLKNPRANPVHSRLTWYRLESAIHRIRKDLAAEMNPAEAERRRRIEAIAHGEPAP